MIRRRIGFTLIELLVVIAIIAILAAILFPVFAKAKQIAKANVCTNNMKQWATALQAYLGDYNSHFPWAGANGWYQHKPGGVPPFGGAGGSATCFKALDKYVANKKGIRWCPLWKYKMTDVKYGEGPYACQWSYWYMCSHDGNYWVPPEAALCGYAVSDVHSPTRKPFLSEVMPIHFAGEWNWSTTLSFCDGHAKCVLVDEARRVTYSARGG